MLLARVLGCWGQGPRGKADPASASSPWPECPCAPPRHPDAPCSSCCLSQGPARREARLRGMLLQGASPVLLCRHFRSRATQRAAAAASHWPLGWQVPGHSSKTSGGLKLKARGASPPQRNAARANNSLPEPTLSALQMMLHTHDTQTPYTCTHDTCDTCTHDTQTYHMCTAHVIHNI